MLKKIIFKTFIILAISGISLNAYANSCKGDVSEINVLIQGHPAMVHMEKHKADFGVSFDGDGDRIICSDEKGKIIDGDKILACLVKYFSSITNNKIKGTVGTHMTNAGLEKFIKKIGLKFYRANVGDKFVYNEMKKKNFIIGGEQSGHIILRDFWPSGDGVLIALCLIK